MQHDEYDGGLNVYGKAWWRFSLCSQAELDHHLTLRTGLFYPLNYGSNSSILSDLL